MLTIGGAHDLEPKPLHQLAGLRIIQIDCGERHCAALDQNGDLYTWGNVSAQYNKGQLGHGTAKKVDQPTRVKDLESQRVVRVACGGYHTIVLTQDNKLFGFGSNQSGECGTGKPQDIFKPTLIDIPPKKKNHLLADLSDPAFEELAKP